MPAPSYARSKNFQADGGDRTDHGAINAELDKVAQAINSLASLIGLVLKDDNTLESGLVLPDALSQQVLNLMTGTDVVTVQGPKGDIGASFRADYRGMASERSTFDDRAKGFCFLAMDTGQLSFKLSNTPGDWSQGYTFAKGDRGDPGPPGKDGLPGAPGVSGAVTSVDTNTVSASLVGRTNVTARLVLQNGILSVVLATT